MHDIYFIRLPFHSGLMYVSNGVSQQNQYISFVDFLEKYIMLLFSQRCDKAFYPHMLHLTVV